MMRARWWAVLLLGVVLVTVVLLVRRSSPPASDSPPDPAARSAQPQVVPAPAEVTATVRVEVSARGAPLPAARVLITTLGHGRARAESATTSAEGIAELALPPGEYGVAVDHPELAVHRERIRLTQAGLVLQVVLEQGGAITGRVVNARSLPIATASIQAFRAGAELVRETQSRADGTFSIEGLPLEPLEIRVRAHPYRPRVQGVRFTRHGERQELRVQLEEGTVVGGRVLTPEGTPVAGAHVGSNDLGGGFVTTDAEGRFELGGLSEKAVHVFATASGFADVHRRSIAPGTRDLELVLERPARVRGTLTLPPQAQSVDVSVCKFDDTFRKEICIARRIYRAPATEYELEGLPSGTYDLVVRVDELPERRAAVQLTAGATVEGPAFKW